MRRLFPVQILACQIDIRLFGDPLTSETPAQGTWESSPGKALRQPLDLSPRIPTAETQFGERHPSCSLLCPNTLVPRRWHWLSPRQIGALVPSRRPPFEQPTREILINTATEQLLKKCPITAWARSIP